MHRYRLFVLLLSLAGLAACDSAPEPVGSVTLEPGAVELPHGGWQRVELAWRMTAPLPDRDGELRVALHLEDPSGELLRTFDHPFPGEWTVGGERSYAVPVFQSALVAPLEPDAYDLSVFLYDTTGHRWPVDAGGGSERAASFASVEPEAGFPEFSFSAEWMPTEPGGDQQILARRWLAGDGAIRVRRIGEVGSLRLRVGIPAANEMQEMVLAEGAVQPAATLVADCSGFEAELGGVGGHTLEIPLAPFADGPAECRIAFSANFELVSKDNGEKRTLALENLAWRAGD